MLFCVAFCYFAPAFWLCTSSQMNVPHPPCLFVMDPLPHWSVSVCLFCEDVPCLYGSPDEVQWRQDMWCLVRWPGVTGFFTMGLPRQITPINIKTAFRGNTDYHAAMHTFFLFVCLCNPSPKIASYFIIIVLWQIILYYKCIYLYNIYIRSVFNVFFSCDQLHSIIPMYYTNIQVLYKNK